MIIEVFELLKRTVPLPLIHANLMGRSADGKSAFHCGFGLRHPQDQESDRMWMTAAYLTHAANSLPKALVALECLSLICTCNRPAIALPGGGTKAPGPHTDRCVRSIAKAAFDSITKVQVEE